MDAVDRTRMAGCIVDFVETLGYSPEDIRAISELMLHHLEVKERQGDTLEFQADHIAEFKAMSTHTDATPIYR